MKKVFILQLIILALSGTTFSQSPCSTAKVVSPIVKKPTNGSIVSATCSTLVVQWKGVENQSYTANVSFYNTATKKWDTTFSSSTACTSCTATFSVTAGTKVHWSVQAQKDISGRTFYSYYLIGDRNYPIPACTQPITKTEVKKEVQEVIAGNDKLVVYPNPATNEITFQWSGGYKGNAIIAITDAAGKIVRVINVNKLETNYTNRIDINTLVSGLYILSVKTTTKLAPLSAKFFKE